MSLIIQKYGGSSVASTDHIRRVAMKVASTKIRGNKIAVVVSAMGGQTDQLLALAAEITNNPPGREQRNWQPPCRSKTAPRDLQALQRCGGYYSYNLARYYGGVPDRQKISTAA